MIRCAERKNHKLRSRNFKNPEVACEHGRLDLAKVSGPLNPILNHLCRRDRVCQTMNMNAEQPCDDLWQRGDNRPESQLAQISLGPPSEKYLDSFFQAMAEFEDEGNPQISENMTKEQFPAYVQQLHDQSVGKNLKEGYVPSKEFWIIDAEGYAGRIILGLSFTPAPDRIGNHVGYAVRPSKRRKGYATKALQCLLDEARKLKIYKLMPICDAANVASRKVIERNGGVLLDHMPNDKARHGALRYIVDLESRPATPDR